MIIYFVISGYSSSIPTHTRRMTLDRCPADFTCRFLCLNAARDVKIEGEYSAPSWQSRDSERLCNVTEHR